MDNGKHLSPSNGKQPMSPKPVVPASRCSTLSGMHAKTTGSTSRAASAAGSSGTSGGPRRPRWFKSWRSAAVAALSAMLVFAGIAGVIAWTTAQDALKNSFEIGTVVPVINEDGPTEDQPFKPGDTIKQNVTVSNTGSVDIYVRARVNIYWIDNAGNQLWEQPEVGKDYAQEGSIPAESGWFKSGDYYYWTSRLEANGETGKLIDRILQSENQVEKDEAAGRKLVIDIDIQGVQADPASAVIEAWKVDVKNDGTLNVGQGA